MISEWLEVIVPTTSMKGCSRRPTKSCGPLTSTRVYEEVVGMRHNVSTLGRPYYDDDVAIKRSHVNDF